MIIDDLTRRSKYLLNCEHLQTTDESIPCGPFCEFGVSIQRQFKASQSVPSYLLTKHNILYFVALFAK